MRKELTRPRRAALHFIIDEENAVLIAHIAQTAQAFWRQGAHPAFALHRLDKNSGCLIRDSRFQRLMIPKFQMGETGQGRAKAFEIFRIACRIHGGKSAAMKGAFESNDFIALWITFAEMIAARAFHRELEAFRARVLKKDFISPRERVAILLRQGFLSRHAEQIGEMPDLV